MAATYDEQLIEAFGVRRRRLTAALLLGPLRTRRQWSDRVPTFVASAFLAVLACSGCVAASFVVDLLARQGGG